MQEWLQNFAYRTTISPLTFILAGGIVVVIALVTVSVQSIKVSLANPIEALRYE
jgi:putative ABC transport system permease protein